MIGDAKDAEKFELEEPVSIKKFDDNDEEAQKALRRLNQIAIVGFWKVDTN